MIVKKAVKAGNSSAVILPRAWLNKEVRIELIEKTPEIILADTLEIIKKYLRPEKIIGIYLVGSYARGEQDENSDIDVLVITDNIDKEMIKEGIYNILIVSYQLLSQKLEQNLFPVGQMIKEAKPLLNSNYLKSIKIKVTNKNVKWYLDTTEEKIKLIKEVTNKSKEKKKAHLDDAVAYTLILRIRTLYIIEKLIKNELYSKKKFLEIIKKLSGLNAYEAYENVKNNSKQKNKVSIEEVEKLNNYLENQLTKIKELL